MKPTSLRQRKHDERTAALLWAFIIQRGLLDQFKRFYIERDGWTIDAIDKEMQQFLN